MGNETFYGDGLGKKNILGLGALNKNCRAVTFKSENIFQLISIDSLFTDFKFFPNFPLVQENNSILFPPSPC